MKLTLKKWEIYSKLASECVQRCEKKNRWLEDSLRSFGIICQKRTHLLRERKEGERGNIEGRIVEMVKRWLKILNLYSGHISW